VPYATEDGTTGGVDGETRIYYEVNGRGTVEGTDAVAFVGEVGFGPWQWGWQAPALAGPYRAVVPTTRGCGRSDAPPTPWAVSDLVADLDAVLSDAGVRSAHLVGTGLGGLVALQAARDLGRIDRLVLLGTPPSADRFDADALAADPADETAVRSSLDAALSAEFREAHPDAVDRIVDWRSAEDATPDAFDAHRAALDSVDAAGWLYEVTNEALVIHGSDDAACPVAAGRDLADGLPRGEFHAGEGAGHLVGVEHSKVVNDRIVAFLDE
jgi:3-oxoadipate enol-lactonase